MVNGAGKNTLKVLLSFAVGCLLGDVFLHLLPEVWVEQADVDGHPSMNKGLWILAGLLIFIVLEKTFAFLQENEEEKEDDKSASKQCEGATTKAAIANGFVAPLNNNNNNNNYSEKTIVGNGHIENDPLTLQKNANPPRQRTTSIHVSGYLNLMANSFDNFTHGLAVGGSFLVSLPHGVLTTFAILLHEIPHEVGDFAILLRSGFTRWDAAKAQVSTAAAGIVGALTAVFISGTAGTIEARTSWMLPFTAGGFLHIALVTVLPDLLKEENPRESFTQLASLLFGIGVMAALHVIVEE
ncbi:Zinc transporter ZIP13 homolog [Gryllus bimaculatus]|nr:Zinc transporter ZIP13 homolog [Gryllus bimaculatus]